MTLRLPAPAAAMALGLALALPAPGPAWAQPAPSAFAPAAFVDGKAVTNYDVEQRARLLRTLGATQTVDLEAGLQSMIDDVLKRRAAEAAGLAVTREDVEAALQRFAAAQGAASPAALEARLRQGGVAPSSAREFLETELLWTQLVRRDYGATTQVTDLELQDEIEAAGLDKLVEFQLGEIALADRGNPEAALARARDLAERVRGGADFGALARANSDSPTARAGGVIGWVPRDRLPPGLSDQIATLPVGGILDPFPVPGGVVVLGLLDRREQTRELSAEDREAIRLQLLERRLSRRADARLAELRAGAYVERR